jgi:hypothetical protein
MYPFSTQNEKDYNNLLSVYLDAVFFPNIRVCMYGPSPFAIPTEPAACWEGFAVQHCARPHSPAPRGNVYLLGGGGTGLLRGWCPGRRL